ncbi:amidohydrolase family protein [Kitasatospora sp. NPDC056184]|uniref:metal-dependent hydrolase family protein n=1 Tax=Kitasatospora sp. NPDC056184 TaxID=3345738 RepID=UPI0035E21827
MTARILHADLVLPDPADQGIADGAVLVVDGRIELVGTYSEVHRRTAPQTPVHHFPGATILPGLIDCHVHLSMSGEGDAVATLDASDDRSLLLAMAGRAQELLNAGVTTVRDLGDRGGLAFALRDAIAAGRLPGPRILAAGAPVTVTGGHCWYLGGQADGVEEIRAVVRRNVQNGADVIKVMATGGGLTPDGPAPWVAQYTDEEVRAAVEEARRFGRPVAAHVHGSDGVRIALEAGVDTLEHCTFIPPPGSARGPDDAAAELIKKIAAEGTSVCPTFSAVLDETIKRIGESGVRPWLDLVRHQHEQGVRLLAGTDAGIPGSGFGQYVDGLEWFARAGLDNASILTAATSAAADALGVGHRTGRLRTGLEADLLVVDGDPRTELAALRRSLLVLARGRAFRPRGEFGGLR